MTQAPTPLAAPSPNTAYGQPFATISNIVATPTPTGFTVTATTDQPIMLQMDWWPQNSALPVGPGTAPVEAGPTTNHSFTVSVGAGYAGQIFGFNFRQDSNDTSGLLWRPYQGLVQLTGARTVANQKAVPVRFYQFGGTPPPSPGGSTGVGQNTGNWNTYIWAQYNPKLTTYPTP